MSEIKQTVAERLSDLLTTGKFSDTEFILQNGDKVKGHKLIFAIASPVFEAMLYGGLAENESEIMIDDIDAKGFKTMAEFIYSDNLKLDSVGHAISAYKAADKYDLPLLREKTFEFIKLCNGSSNALEILEFSKLCTIPSTEEECVKLLRENTYNVISSAYASKCSIDVLQTIVDEEKLKIHEVELFKLVEKWAKCYSESNDVPLDAVKPDLKNIISKIRFLNMTVNEFLSFPFKSQLLTVEEKHSVLFNLNEPNSVALPENLCNSTRYRDTDQNFTLSLTCVPLNCKNEYSIQWRLTNLAEIKFGFEYYSPTFYVGDIPFKINFYPRILDEEKYVDLYLKCDREEKQNDSEWSCNMKYSFKLTTEEGKPIIYESENVTFKEKLESERGWHKFCKWSNISLKNSKDCNRGILIEANVKLL